MIYFGFLALCIKIFGLEYQNRENRVKMKDRHDTEHFADPNSIFKDSSLSMPIKSSNTALRCMNTRFINNMGTYLEGTRSYIFITETEMIYKVSDFTTLPKYINAHESSLEIKKCRFVSSARLNREMKICSIDPVGVINISSTEFSDLTYKNDSSSGIVFQNCINKDNFTVCFSKCRISVDSDNSIRKGNKGGFYYQYEANSDLLLNNCYFEGTSSKESGGCLYINTYADISGCDFDNCFSKDGSVLYFSKISRKYNLFNCTILNIIEGNNIFSFNSDGIDILELKEINFQNISNQRERIIGIRAHSVKHLVFNHCTISTKYLNKYPILISDDKIIEFKFCVLENNNKFNTPMINIRGDNSLFENNEYTGNAPIGTFQGDSITFSNCTFYNSTVTSYLVDLSVLSINFSCCVFRDIEGQMAGYGGLGLKTPISTDLNFTNCLFERVGTTNGSGGIYIFQRKIKSFFCINCTCIRCYSHSYDCCFTFIDESGEVNRETRATYQSNTFIECHITDTDLRNIHRICAIRFNSNSDNSYVEITNCTFTNPGLIKHKNIRQCAYQVIGPYFVIFGNTFLNSSNSLVSIQSTLQETSTKNYVSENHTFINVSCYDILLYYTKVGNFKMKNCYFKDMYNKVGRGIGLVLENTIPLGVTFTNCTFINCVNDETAAVYYTIGSNEFPLMSFVMRNCSVNGTKSPEDGAIKLVSTTCLISDSIFSNCHSSDGGCFYCSSMNNVIIVSCEFYNNEATSNGGCIFFQQTSNKFHFENLTATNNRAGTSGSVVFFENQVGVFDLDFYRGEGNYALFGDVCFVTVDSSFQRIDISKMTNKSIGIIDVYDFTISSGSGSVTIDSVHDVEINNFDSNIFNISCDVLRMNNISSKSGIIKLNSTESIQLSNLMILSTPDILLNSTQISINKSFFKFARNVVSQSQLKILKPNSFLNISNSTFTTKLNQYGDGDVIYSKVTINLIIDKDCCFNTGLTKSIRVAHGSIIDVPNTVFNCLMSTEVIDEIIKSDKKFDLIGFFIILVSIIIMVVLVTTYCIISERKLAESSDEFDMENIGQIQLEINETTMNTQTVVNDNNKISLLTMGIEDFSDNDIIYQAFTE